MTMTTVQTGIYQALVDEGCVVTAISRSELRATHELNPGHYLRVRTTDQWLTADLDYYDEKKLRLASTTIVLCEPESLSELRLFQLLTLMLE